MPKCSLNNLSLYRRDNMKIGILSMQRIVNNGSFLQAYALKETLKMLSGYEPEFIDFENALQNKKNKEKEQPFLLQFLRNVKHLIFPQYWPYSRTKRNGKLFAEKWAECLPALGLKRELNDFQREQYTLIVIGSDEVFNLCQFSDENVDIPWCLLGEGLNTKHLISYAASCGQTSVDGLRAIGEEQHCRDLLSKFDAISVRDENTFHVVHWLSGRTPRYTIDPVLLVSEFPKDESYRKLPYKYMLVYAYTRRINATDEISAIQSYAKEHGLKTVGVNSFQTWCDRLIVCSPFALLQYVQDANCIVTDTFHGTVFSIRENVPFATLVRKSNSNKIRFLLHQFGLDNREADSPDRIKNILDQPIDFTAVNAQLEEERKNARQYLLEHIRNAEEKRRGA